jgi:hypothetical protein
MPTEDFMRVLKIIDLYIDSEVWYNIGL